MKICTIDSYFRTASRSLAILGAVFFGATFTASLVSAQSAGGLMASPRNGILNHGNESFRVVSTAAYRTAADVKRPEAGTVKQVGSVDPMGIMPAQLASCTTCGPGGGVYASPIESYGSGLGGCNSCGTSCGGACSGDFGSYGGCGIPCDPYCYIMVEGIYMRPDESNFEPSNNFSVNNFDYEFGSRITVGSVGDCVHGYEVSFVGPLEWDLNQQLPSLPINTVLSPLVGFTNVVDQRHTYSAEYWSLEANKTLVGWEVAKLLIGTRYLNYDEDYNYFTQADTGERGSLHSRTENQLFGLQVGADLLYPISTCAFTDFRARAGAFINFADLSFGTINDGVPSFGSDDDKELAGMIELGTGVRYQLGEILSVRAGMELWYLAGVSQAPSEAASVVRGSRQILADDDVLFTGLSFGAELRY